MKLSWRDAAATVLVGASAAVMISVVNGWNWPLVGDVRAGVIAVLLLGFAASVLGGGPQWFMAALRPGGTSSQGRWFTAVAAVLGLATLVLLVANLFVNSVDLLVLGTGALVAIWVVATVHHAIESTPPLTPAT